MDALTFLIMPVFLISLYITFKFIWGKEGKGKQGEEILKKSALAIAPIFPIGWLLLEWSQSIFNISYEMYRDLLGVLVGIYFITQGFLIFYYKQKRQVKEVKE
ncbi:hypothetical protein [Oceanobacillus kapialis]|uniref:hypothetical protein n=1 Tax=Oceanobacillus kapialis TaxID=481353 RepID=UPI00384EDB91